MTLSTTLWTLAATAAVGLGLAGCANSPAVEAGSGQLTPASGQPTQEAGLAEGQTLRADVGQLPVTVLLPEGEGPFSMLIMLHGCNGLRRITWDLWIRPWTGALRPHRIGVVVVDSFARRGIEQVCTGDVAGWAVRRAADVEAVREWLASQPYVLPDRIAVLGMSNGGRTVLAALRGPGPRSGAGIRAGVALYPGCQSDIASQFHAPLLVLTGGDDTVAPPRYCEAMRDAQRSGSAPVSLVVYPGALHSFDVALPRRRYLGMELGGDRAAAADARSRVLRFLEANGIGD